MMGTGVHPKNHDVAKAAPTSTIARTAALPFTNAGRTMVITTAQSIPQAAASAAPNAPDIQRLFCQESNISMSTTAITAAGTVLAVAAAKAPATPRMIDPTPAQKAMM